MNNDQQVSIFLSNGSILIANERKFIPIHQTILYEFQDGKSKFLCTNLTNGQKALIPKQNTRYISTSPISDKKEDNNATKD